MTLYRASPEAATRALRDTLQRVLSCVTTGVFAWDSAGPLTSLRLTVRLNRSGRGFITLNLLHTCGVVSDAARPARERWYTVAAGYFYTLADAEGQEIVAYHWHPTGRSHVTVPHLHLGAGAGRLTPEMSTAHLSTGTITPVAVLTLAIEAFGVNPRRTDWGAVFEDAQAGFGDS